MIFLTTGLLSGCFSKADTKNTRLTSRAQGSSANFSALDAVNEFEITDSGRVNVRTGSDHLCSDKRMFTGKLISLLRR
jgi:hypothetical protein